MVMAAFRRGVKGISGIAAEEFKNRLMWFGVDIECIVDTHIIKWKLKRAESVTSKRELL